MRLILTITISLLLVMSMTNFSAFAENPNEVISSIPKAYRSLTSGEFVTQSWAASSNNNEEKLFRLIDAVNKLFGPEADLLQSQLTSFPPREKMNDYEVLNNVATCFFIQSEFLMNTGRTESAIESFTTLIERFPHAKAWDPRGWYWSIAEKSQASIDVMTGKDQEEDDETKLSKRTKPYIHTPGTAEIIDYAKYGNFLNVGKEDYKYAITDIKGLADAVGEGIYPNVSAIYKNPKYKELKKSDRMEGSHWDFVLSEDLEAAFFKWATAPEPEGVKLFYIGTIFERAGMMYEAIKAYYALVVHFPKTVAWTYWGTPWYPASAAIGKIRHLLRIHQEIPYADRWMKITVENSYDNDPKNDIFYTYPGKIIAKSLVEKVKGKLQLGKKVKLSKIKKTVGNGRVQLKQFENNHWQLLVDKKPFIIKGITYAPTKIGQSPDKGTLRNWMEEDTNSNGKPDGPYDAWVDANFNNKQDKNEKNIGDFQLMSEMGANVIRIYHDPETPIKEVLRDLYENYGIMVIMGDFLGKYARGSGATWAEGTDYENEEHKANMLASVKKMVMEHKDEPYVLLWLLGNENNYGVGCNADKKPAAFFKFANEVAQWIKSVDSNHPVAVNNGDTLFLDIFAEHGKDIDLFSANVYRGDYGFGSFWQQVKDASDKPVFITEYGAPAYAQQLTLAEADQAQADYHLGNWFDIAENSAGFERGVGNSVGGIIFEWMDEWWKNYEPFYHDKKSDAIGPFPGGYYYEEWFGIVSQGDGSNSPFMRQLRKSYDLYKEMWNRP